MTSICSGIRSFEIAICAVLLAVLPALGADPGPRPALPAGVSAGWWSQVQRSIQLEEYGIVRAGAEGAEGAEFRATNPAHRFAARFDAGGMRLTPSDGAAWVWGLTLTGWGRPGSVDAVSVAGSCADEDRVEFDRGPLTEWFVNTPRGLEHGFTVPVRPRAEGERLVFDLAFAGGLRPVFAEDGQAIDFYGAGNVSVLRYAKLVVTDASGSNVPARMEPIVGGVRIVVDDAGAVYPLTVDPLATSASWTAVGEGPVNYFGISVATAGDVNGDGYSDVVVGASGYADETGKAYLYLGGASGLSASATWTAVGESPGDRFAVPVAPAGDVNGDGYSDVVVGAPYATYTGKAYLYLGGASGLSAVASWTAKGEGTYDYFGRRVGTAGDVNADGYSDVVVAAYGYAGETGKAYVYLGGPSGLSATASWAAEGQGTSDQFGYGAATAGDVNGDGYSDVVIGASGHGGYTGKAYVYLGGASGLSAAASWIAVGEASSDYFGRSVETAGDIDGDGYSDVVVGAFGYAGNTGKAYVYRGSASGPSAAASWTAVGEGANNSFANTAATAGDVNGDGYSDVIIGASGHVGYTGNATGKAYVYLGGASGLSSAASWTAVAEGPYDFLGVSVAPAGDVNGDGYSDVVIGAHGYSEWTGKAYLYLGGASGLSAGAPWTAVGEGAGDFFAASVKTAGDVNGDGYSDVVIGAAGYGSYTGKAYLYLGSASGLSAAASWTAVGEGTYNEFGQSVATAGDVNGDGYSDVVIGARAYDGWRGKGYLYLGGASGLSVVSSWTAVGEYALDFFGYSVATAGDVNGDGYSDVIIGAFGYGSYTGKAYLYLGGASGLSAAASWIAEGEGPDNRFGWPVATAGDVNGDGYSDVVIGAYNNAGFTGKVYLYLGGASGLSATESWTAVGEGPGHGFGWSAATAGDVNGDGYSDTVVGAYGNASNAGKAYLYLGSASGLPAAAFWTAVGEGANNHFGWSVATAEDVNGDGYSDVVIGAYRYLTDTLGETGKAYVYLGGSEAGGVTVVPRQWRADLSAPISVGGAAYEQKFRLGLTLRSPAGRVWRKLQWQVAPWGSVFSPAVNPIQSDAHWYDTPVARTLPVTLDEDLQRYVWRARVRYRPASSPFVPWGPWFTMTGNGLRETDLFSTSEPPPQPCTRPDEDLYIVTVTEDANGKPVLHYQDPNQPAEVTGYNVYRASTPTGPWTLLGSNVVDMDEGTPNKQYVDQTGDGVGDWFYQVAAYNAACGVEGPW